MDLTGLSNSYDSYADAPYLGQLAYGGGEMPRGPLDPAASQAFKEELNRKSQIVNAERNIYGREYENSMKNAMAPFSPSREQLMGMAMMAALPILIGLAARGKKGASAGGAISANAVEAFTHGLSKEWEDEGQRRRFEAQKNLDLLRMADTESKGYSMLGLRHQSQEAFAPIRLAQQEALANTKGNIQVDVAERKSKIPSPETLGSTGGVEIVPEGATSPSVPTITPSGFNDPVAGPNEIPILTLVPRPQSEEYDKILAAGQKRYGPSFNLNDAPYAKYKAAALEAFPERKQNIIQAEGAFIKGIESIGIKPSKAFIASLGQSEILGYSKLFLEHKQKNLSEDQLVSAMTNLEIRDDIGVLEGSLEMMVKQMEKEGSDGEGWLANYVRGLKGGQFPVFGRLTLGGVGAALTDAANMGFYEYGSPEASFLRNTNYLAMKIAALYNGKRLSDMDFLVFRDYLGSDKFFASDPRQILANLRDIKTRLTNQFEKRLTLQSAAGFNVSDVKRAAAAEAFITEKTGEKDLAAFARTDPREFDAVADYEINSRPLKAVRKAPLGIDLSQVPPGAKAGYKDGVLGYALDGQFYPLGE